MHGAEGSTTWVNGEEAVSQTDCCSGVSLRCVPSRCHACCARQTSSWALSMAAALSVLLLLLLLLVRSWQPLCVTHLEDVACLCVLCVEVVGLHVHDLCDEV